MKCKVLLLVPPLVPILGNEKDIFRGRDSYTARYPHLGLAYIAAVLRQRGITYAVIDMNLGYDLFYVLSMLNNNLPDFICITVYSAGYKAVYSLTDSIKRNYGVTVILGGPHLSIVKSQALKDTQADFAVIGEGEHTLPALIESLDPAQIQGLVWRKSSEVIVNDRKPYLQNLDNLPWPAFEDFELEKYLCYTDKRLPIVTSRGCPFHCIYCCTPLTMGNKFRARSAEDVVGEMLHWYKKGWSTFDINDDIFTFNKKRAKRICELILEIGLKIKFNLSVGIRANSVDEELLRFLKSAGCRFISYGCEAGNDRIMKDIKKGINISDVINVVNLTNKIGIKHKVNFIIGHPTEQYEDAVDSVRLAKTLKCSFVGFNNLIPYPGTEAYNLIKNNPTNRFLFQPEQYLNDLTHKRLMPVFETKKFPAKKKRKILKKGFRLEEKTLAVFRFGKFLGILAFIINRNRYISKVAHWFLYLMTYTRIGSKIYGLIIKSPW